MSMANLRNAAPFEPREDDDLLLEKYSRRYQPGRPCHLHLDEMANRSRHWYQLWRILPR